MLCHIPNGSILLRQGMSFLSLSRYGDEKHLLLGKYQNAAPGAMLIQIQPGMNVFPCHVVRNAGVLDKIIAVDNNNAAWRMFFCNASIFYE